MSISFEQKGIVYDTRQHRLRYNSHVINLAVSALFLANSSMLKDKRINLLNLELVHQFKNCKLGGDKDLFISLII